MDIPGMTGAGLRALLVMATIAAPSVLLGVASADARQMVALAAVFAGGLTWVEYRGATPGLVGFREAKPFNRIRFAMVCATVVLLSLIEAGRTAPTPLTEFLRAVGALIGAAMDFPGSPVRLATDLMARADPGQGTEPVRTAAGMALLVALLSLSVFVLVLRPGAWPRRNGAFNVWVNLPTFDPSAGGDVVARLRRDARVNIALGFLLPFWMPVGINLAAPGFQPLSVASPQTLIWTVTAWSFLPASLFMRGVGLGRVAAMIADKRRLSAQGAEAGLVAA
ncbi:MAG: hypothetical protein ACT4N9_08275 [Paracoccaceae bacterium]